MSESKLPRPTHHIVTETPRWRGRGVGWTKSRRPAAEWELAVLQLFAAAEPDARLEMLEACARVLIENQQSTIDAAARFLAPDTLEACKGAVEQRVRQTINAVRSQLAG